MGADLKATLVKALVAIVALGIIGSTCAGWATHRVQAAYEQATRTAERDSSRARARRHEQIAREKFALAESKAHVADSLARVARRSDSLATLKLAHLKPVADTNSLAELRAGIHARDSVIAAQAEALADARLVAPAYAVSVELFRPAVEASLIAAGEAQRADTLSQTLGEQAEHDAHWRGVKQGVKGTLVVAALSAGAVTLVKLFLKGTL